MGSIRPLFQREGDLKEALRSFDHALEIAPGEEPTLYHKARLLEQMGNRSAEIACYDELIKNNPESIYPWLKKGLVLMLNEEYGRSFGCFSIASRLDNPGHMPYLLKGLVLAIQGRYEDAIPCLEEAHTLSPTEPDIILQLGRALGSAERPQDAVATFNQVLEIKPDSLDASEGKVRALFQLGEWEELCRICEECRSRDPKNHVWYQFEAKVKGWHTGKVEEAMSLLEEGRSVIPDDDHLDLVIADLAADTGRIDISIAILKDALSRNQDRVSCLYRLAKLSIDQGEHQEAVKTLKAFTG